MSTDSMTVKDTAHAVSPAGTVTVEPIEHLERYWPDAGSPLGWECLFMLPPWLRAWWSFFGQGLEPHLCIVRRDDALLGVAPLVVQGDTARLIGDSDLIDYSDFIVAPAREREFFPILFDHLRRRGIKRLEAGRVRADSTAITCLKAFSVALGCEVSCEPADVLYEMELPGTWGGYLNLLSATERHEVRRKLRRLDNAGRLTLRVIEEKGDLSAAMDTFIILFRSNQPEKAQFMVGRVESFFRSLADSMAGAGLLKLFFLDLNDDPAAAAMCFDYQSTVYLYNNGYDSRFRDLSVGLLSKVFSIQESILRGRKGFNFLRGSETYKRRLGGHPVNLDHCEVILK